MTVNPAVQTNTFLPNLEVPDLTKLYDLATAQAYRSSGAGNFYAQYQTILSRIDRFGNNTILPNHELEGLTFITRPKLNLSTPSLRQDRILATLDTRESMSIPFAIRCYLDTKFSRETHISKAAIDCPFFNSDSPFIIPLTNCLMSVSGFPDYMLETETTEGGFYQEAMSFVKGSDRGARGNYDVTVTFRDIQGGFIFSLFYHWIRFMDLVSRGDVFAYAEDIDARRLCYTSSIYRFILDPSRQYIVKWAKATGSFPTSLPTGSVFNVNEHESFIKATERLSIPFKVNNFSSPMDPIIFREFNTIVGNFNPLFKDEATIRNNIANKTLVLADSDPSSNFSGTPYIDTVGGVNQLLFLCEPTELVDPYQEMWSQIQSKLGGTTSNLLTENPTINTVPTSFTNSLDKELIHV